MAKFLSKCPQCRDVFTNYDLQPKLYCCLGCESDYVRGVDPNETIRMRHERSKEQR